MFDSILKAAVPQVDTTVTPDIPKKKPRKQSVKKENVEIVPEKVAVYTEVKEESQDTNNKENLPVLPGLPRPDKSIFNMIMDNIDKSQMQLTQDDEKILKKSITTIHDSVINIIRKCNGSTCAQKDICPFSAIDKYPCGQLCPVEKSIADFMSYEYYKLLEEENGNNNFSIIEITTVNGLIEVEIEEFRARSYSNIDGMMKSTPIFVMDKTGQIVYNDVEHPIYNLRERLDRRKAKLLNRLVITPEAKARYGIADVGKDNRTTKDMIKSAEEKIKILKERIGK